MSRVEGEIVEVGVAVWVGVGVKVAAGVVVDVATGVAVALADAVGVTEFIGDGVSVGAAVGVITARAHCRSNFVFRFFKFETRAFRADADKRRSFLASRI